MVDLAFLLLTFFILTSTFIQRNTLQVDMPEKAQDSTSLPRLSENHVLTLALTEKNKLYWWMGDDRQASRTSYAKDGVRKILLDHAAADKDLFVLIKPKDNSRYENMIDILDEIDITHTQHGSRSRLLPEKTI
jgi:biopolymer transport protein ExbD